MSPSRSVCRKNSCDSSALLPGIRRNRIGTRPRLVPARPAIAGRNLIVHLRRQRVGEPFADEDDRLPSLSQPAKADDQRLQRGQRHIVADPLGLDRRHVVDVVFLELIPRRVVVLAAGEPADGARQSLCGSGSDSTSLIDHSGYMMPAMSAGCSWFSTNCAITSRARMLFSSRT